MQCDCSKALWVGGQCIVGRVLCESKQGKNRCPNLLKIADVLKEIVLTGSISGAIEAVRGILRCSRFQIMFS